MAHRHLLKAALAIVLLIGLAGALPAAARPLAAITAEGMLRVPAYAADSLEVGVAAMTGLSTDATFAPSAMARRRTRASFRFARREARSDAGFVVSTVTTYHGACSVEVASTSR